MQNKRIPTDYIVSRKQKRAIAKKHMKEAGKKHFCKHSYTHMINNNELTRVASYFALNWRDWVEPKTN